VNPTLHAILFYTYATLEVRFPGHPFRGGREPRHNINRCQYNPLLNEPHSILGPSNHLRRIGWLCHRQKDLQVSRPCVEARHEGAYIPTDPGGSLGVFAYPVPLASLSTVGVGTVRHLFRAVAPYNPLCSPLSVNHERGHTDNSIICSRRISRKPHCSLLLFLLPIWHAKG
jgi:hypothetical protein